ncbi:MAG TPA: lipase secretion chaperone [Rhodoferax sp.]|nr:lipase secretion chaperone [Rhodoferax sp.]
MVGLASPTPLRLGLMALALAAVGIGVWQGTAPDSAVPQMDAERVAGAGGAFVRSMQGTQPDGDLQALQSGSGSMAGGALAYGELRRLFDYYLSAVGEETLDAIVAQIRSELNSRLSSEQAQRAQRLLGLYIEFKRELVEVDAKPELAGNGVAAIRKRMLAVQDLRARYFTQDEVQGMFGFEDAYDMDAIARLEVSEDTTLTAQQKQQQLAALDAAMPEALRREREASHGVVRVEQQAVAMRAKGATDDDIYRMRANEFDPQAAARLAEVDREEAAWKARIAHFQSERGRVMKNMANASESERQSALAQLQQSLFTEAERPRLVAYE